MRTIIDVDSKEELEDMNGSAFIDPNLLIHIALSIEAAVKLAEGRDARLRDAEARRAYAA